MQILPHQALTPSLFFVMAALLTSACAESSVDVLIPSDVPGPNVVISDLPATTASTIGKLEMEWEGD